MSRLLRFFNDHLRAHAPLIAGASLLLLLAGLCQGALIASIKFVFDDGKAHALPAAQTGLFGQLEHLRAWAMAHLPEASALRTGLLIPLVLVLLFAMKGLFTYAGTLLMVRSGIRATQAFRERLFAHLLTQEPAFFQKHPVGELITRSISDVGAVQGIASNQLAEAVREICVALTMLATVLYMDWQLSLTLFLAGPLVVLPVKRLSQRIRKVNHRNQEASSRLLQRLKEVFSNIRVVQGFARESYEVTRFQLQNQELYRLGMKSARASALSTPTRTSTPPRSSANTPGAPGATQPRETRRSAGRNWRRIRAPACGLRTAPTSASTGEPCGSSPRWWAAPKRTAAPPIIGQTSRNPESKDPAPSPRRTDAPPGPSPRGTARAEPRKDTREAPFRQVGAHGRRSRDRVRSSAAHPR